MASGIGVQSAKRTSGSCCREFQSPSLPNPVTASYQCLVQIRITPHDEVLPRYSDGTSAAA